MVFSSGSTQPSHLHQWYLLGARSTEICMKNLSFSIEFKQCFRCTRFRAKLVSELDIAKGENGANANLLVFIFLLCVQRLTVLNVLGFLQEGHGDGFPLWVDMLRLGVCSQKTSRLRERPREQVIGAVCGCCYAALWASSSSIRNVGRAHTLNLRRLMRR